jgi:hypothetical protein
MDDRVDKLISEEEVPQQGTSQVNGKWSEVTEEQAEKQDEEQRKEWDKKHPDAKEGTGPYAYRTTVTLRRSGVAVPQTVLVKFADGSSETALWDDNRRWARFSWVKPVKAVSAEIDPQHQHYLDANKLDDSRTIKADRSASNRWTAEVAALIELLFSTVTTI